MSLGDLPYEKYPRTWSEMSYDFKLMFVYHGSMMVLFLAGSLVPIRVQLGVAATLLLALTMLSVSHRRRTPWTWPGVSATGVLGALAAVVLGCLFLFSATPLFPPTNPAALPWYLAGGGIILFWVLRSLRLVAFSEVEYLHPESGATPARPTEAQWKKFLRVCYSIVFLAVWLEAVAFFYCFGTSFRDGALVPTNTQTQPLRNHGQVVYVTPAQKHLLDVLETAMFVGIPSVMGFGAFLHLILGVPLLPNVPTFSQMRKRSE